MSELLEKARTALEAKFAGSDFGSSVKFVIEGEGTIVANGGEVTIADDATDVTLSASAEVFEEIIAGELDGASAFMSGKLKIDGDMGVAMQLGQVLG